MDKTITQLTAGTPLTTDVIVYVDLNANETKKATIASFAVKPGLITASGLTMATAKILGRSTALTGAIEEITIGSGLTLSAGVLSYSGGSGVPGGSDTQVQFNDGGSFGGATMTWNKSTETLNLPADAGISGAGDLYIFSSSGSLNLNALNSSTGLRIQDGISSIFAIFNTGSLTTSDKTFTFPDQSGTIATTTYVDSAAKDQIIKAYQALGSTVMAESVGMSLDRIVSSVALADGTMRFYPIYLNKDATLTGVKWAQIVQGSYTGDNENRIGLYSYSGGTLTLVASTTNDANLWQTVSANRVGNKDFSSTYAASAGLYFIGVLYNQSAQVTAPTLGASTVLVNAGMTLSDFTNSAKLSFTLSAQNTLPSPFDISTGTASTAIPWLGLY